MSLLTGLDDKNSFRALIMLAALGLAIFGLFFSYNLGSTYERLLSQNEAVSIARTFILQNNLSDSIDSYTSVVSYGSHEEALLFLEKAIGSNLSKYASENYLPLLYYEVMFYKESDGDTINDTIIVEIDADTNRIAYFANSSPSLANLTGMEWSGIEQVDLSDGDKARLNKSMEFIKSLGFDLERLDKNETLIYREIGTQETQGAAGWDFRGFSFLVKDSYINSEFGEAWMYLDIYFVGDEIVRYECYLKLSDEALETYSSQKEQQNIFLLGSIFGGLFFPLLTLGVIVTKFIKKQTGQFKWRFFIAVSIVFMAVWFVDAFISTSGTGSMQTILALGIGVLFSLGMLLSGVAGESLAVEVWPEKVRDLSEFVKGRVLSKSVSYSILRGYLVAAVGLGVTASMAYIGITYLGWFIPPDAIIVDNLITHPVPFLAVLTLSLTAALSEELTYRLFGISFFKKYLKSTLLAVLVTTVIFGVGHFSLTSLPFYVNAIGASIASIILAYAFLRYNLTTAVVAHFVYDIVAIGLILLNPNDIYALAPLAIILVLPLLFASAGLSKKE